MFSSSGRKNGPLFGPGHKHIEYYTIYIDVTLLWRHNGHDSVSNHQPHGCLFNPLIRRRSKKTSKLRVTGLCAGNSPGTGEFPAEMASNAENVSIWWRHHEECFYISYMGANDLIKDPPLNIDYLRHDMDK